MRSHPGHRRYGKIYMGEGKSGRAHRVAYMLFKGEIGEKAVIDHLCGNTLCVNPEHLEQVTREENSRRGLADVYACKHCKREITEVVARCRKGEHKEGSGLDS